MNPIAPPLKTWIYAFVTVLLIGTSFVLCAYSPYGAVGRRQQQLAAIAAKSSEDSAAISMVFVGSSLIIHGFGADFQLEDKIWESKHKKVSLWKVRLSADLDYIKHTHFYTYLSQQPPTYLFVESNPIYIRTFTKDTATSPPQIPYPISMMLAEVIQQIKSRFFRQKASELSALFYLNVLDTMDVQKREGWKYTVNNFSQNQWLNAALEDLQAKGTKIIFLDMPRVQRVEYLYQEKHKRERNALIQTYKEKYNIDTWQYGRMNDSCFFDGGHLNYKGSKLYQAWFITKLADLK